MKSRIPELFTAGGLVLAGALATPALAQDAKPAPAPAAKPACPAPKLPPKVLETKDLKVGTGRDVKYRTAVLVNYTGWVYDGCAKDLKGTQFDTSVGRATPFGFMVGVGKVIKGWDEGLIGMKEKEHKRLLVIPPHMAYGDRAVADGKIPANSTLVFEVETVGIVYQPDEEPARK